MGLGGPKTDARREGSTFEGGPVVLFSGVVDSTSGADWSGCRLCLDWPEEIRLQVIDLRVTEGAPVDRLFESCCTSEGIPCRYLYF